MKRDDSLVEVKVSSKVQQVSTQEASATRCQAPVMTFKTLAEILPNHSPDVPSYSPFL